MTRFLPYICFILLNLLLCMEAQAGFLGPTPDDEGEVVFLLFLSLSLSLYIYMCVYVFVWRLSLMNGNILKQTKNTELLEIISYFKWKFMASNSESKPLYFQYKHFLYFKTAESANRRRWHAVIPNYTVLGGLVKVGFFVKRYSLIKIYLLPNKVRLWVRF